LAAFAKVCALALERGSLPWPLTFSLSQYIYDWLVGYLGLGKCFIVSD